ncbi:MAG: chemotaxis protein CheW [Pseudomonadota bacterium]
MDELTGEFVSETRETLERIAGALVAWEVRPDDRVQLDEIFRFVHTVKGSCGFLNLPRIEALAHAAEAALADVRSGVKLPDNALVATMLSIIDRIRLLVDALEPETKIELPEISTDAALITALETGTVVTSSAEQEPAAVQRTVRIGVPLLEAMMNQVSELVLVRNEMARALRHIDDRDLTAGFDKLTSVIGELRESVTRTRMQPIERLFATLPRLVRDTANECGKSVTLEIVGQDVEIDREMVESIRDPLIHIVRNAIDHGIEAPDDRVAAGKPRTSVLRIIALQSGNQVSIEISDDGRGIDTAKLIQRAIGDKRIAASNAARLDAHAAASLIFEAGLSTADAVSTISGRGVGMDVVRANVEKLGGSVTLANRPGEGLSVTLRAPLTLSIVTALVVKSGGERFAIPRTPIDEVLSLRSASVRFEQVGDTKIAVVRGTPYPAFELSSLLGMAAGEPQLLVMLSTPSGGRFGLAVDSVGDHEELVVRPMAPLLSTRGIFAGQSLGDDGHPIVVLDPVGLAAGVGVSRVTEQVNEADVIPVEARATVLLATAHDGRKIAVRAGLIERLIEIDRNDWVEVGAECIVTVDGEHLVGASFGKLEDASAFPGLLLNAGHQRSVVAVAAIHDLVPLADLARVSDEAFEGMFRHEGGAILLVDAALLLEKAFTPAGTRPVAAIALDDTPWVRSILAPLVAASGYDVRFGEHADADLVIHLEGETSPHARHSVALARGDQGGVAADRYDSSTLRALVPSLLRKSA